MNRRRGHVEQRRRHRRGEDDVDETEHSENDWEGDEDTDWADGEEEHWGCEERGWEDA